MNLLDKIEQLRCKHRHTREEHPACFAEANIDYAKADKLAKKYGVPWFQMPEYRIGILDIESDGLRADFSTMLTWAIKEYGGKKTTVGVITKKELFTGVADKRLVEDLIKEIEQYKILVTYYGTGFDIPYVRTKALHYGLEFPEYSDLYNFDLYYTVKSKLNLSRKSLDNACDYLGIKGKTPIDKEVWRQAKYGDPEALREVLNHNIADVDITEKLYTKLIPFRKWIKTSI